MGSHTMHKPTIVIHGATSFTAAPMLKYLEEHEDRDAFEFILAGRNKAKLDGLNVKLKQPREVVAVDLRDDEEVRDLVSKADVVLNLAGPFRWYHAEALISECAHTGKHYLDLSAEGAWLAKTIIPKYDYLASTTGACIIPSAGFDSVPSDISLYQSLRTLQSSHPEAFITKSRAFFKVAGSVSGGSAQSIRSIAELPPDERGNQEWELISMHGPSPTPRMIYKTTNPATQKPLIGSFWFMYPYNRCIVRRSWFISRLNHSATSRSTTEEDSTEPIHGPDLVYEEAMQLGSRFQALIVSAGLMFVGLMMFGSRLTRRFMSFFLPAPGGGGTEEQLKKGFLRLTSVSETTLPGVTVVTTCNINGDPGYVSTGWMLAEGALSLILPTPKGTSLPPMSKQGGVLTPSTALGSVLPARLKRSGKVIWDSRIVDSKAL